MIHNRTILIGGAAVAGIALLAMLAYNFVHTGGLLARYVDPAPVGYVAAFGIELAVVALSVAIGTKKYHGLNSRGLVGVLIAVLIVSFLANVEQGHLTRYRRDITWITFGTIDWIQGMIGLAATGLVSLIVMAMSEITGQYLVQLSNPDGQGGSHDTVDELSRSGNGETKTDQAKLLLTQYPTWTNARIARAIPCDPSTVTAAKKQLIEAGQWAPRAGSMGDNGSSGL